MKINQILEETLKPSKNFLKIFEQFLKIHNVDIFKLKIKNDLQQIEKNYKPGPA